MAYFLNSSKRSDILSSYAVMSLGHEYSAFYADLCSRNWETDALCKSEEKCSRKSALFIENSFLISTVSSCHLVSYSSFFERVNNLETVVFLLLSNSTSYEVCVPTFRNALSVTSL
jgi:hypothetical protein